MYLILFTAGGVLLGLAFGGVAMSIATSLGAAIGMATLIGAITWVTVSVIGLAMGLIFQFG